MQTDEVHEAEYVPVALYVLDPEYADGGDISLLRPVVSVLVTAQDANCGGD